MGVLGFDLDFMGMCLCVDAFCSSFSPLVMGFVDPALCLVALYGSSGLRRFGRTFSSYGNGIQTNGFLYNGLFFF